MKRLPKLLLLAAVLLVSIGIALAVVRPGSLDDEAANAETAQPAVTETETETGTGTTGGGDDGTETETATTGTSTSTTVLAAPGVDGQAEGDDEGPGASPTTVAGGTAPTSPTTAEHSKAAPPTTTTPTRPSGTVDGDGDGDDGGGSGLAGGADTASDTEDGLANTGGTSAAGFALLAGVAGLALRRRTG